MIIILESVATAIDDQTFITYAMYGNGNIDWSSELPLENCSQSWHDCLNKEDKYMVEHLMDVKKHSR